MFDITKAEKGDVLLYRSESGLVGGLIGFFSNLGRKVRYGGNYVHAAMYVGGNRVIHSHLEVDKKAWISGAKETGVHKAEIPQQEYDFIDIYRLPFKLTYGDEMQLINWLNKQMGKPYDLAAFPASFFRSVLARIFGWKNFRKGKPLLNDDDRWFCSELVSMAYLETLGIKINPKVHPQSQTPSDLASKNSILKKIS